MDRLAAALEGRYRVLRELGAGGLATVYLAQDLRHGREVAIKVLASGLSKSLARERFVREIRLAAGLTHPHILPLYDSGEADGLLYFVMPVMRGHTLRDRLKQAGVLPLDEAVRIAAEVADALDYAHRHDVVHRVETWTLRNESLKFLNPGGLPLCEERKGGFEMCPVWERIEHDGDRGCRVLPRREQRVQPLPRVVRRQPASILRERLHARLHAFAPATR